MIIEIFHQELLSSSHASAEGRWNNFIYNCHWQQNSLGLPCELMTSIFNWDSSQKTAEQGLLSDSKKEENASSQIIQQAQEWSQAHWNNPEQNRQLILNWIFEVLRQWGPSALSQQMSCYPRIDYSLRLQSESSRYKRSGVGKYQPQHLESI